MRSHMGGHDAASQQPQSAPWYLTQLPFRDARFLASWMDCAASLDCWRSSKLRMRYPPTASTHSPYLTRSLAVWAVPWTKGSTDLGTIPSVPLPPDHPSEQIYEAIACHLALDGSPIRARILSCEAIFESKRTQGRPFRTPAFLG